jgi:protocatechuate 3,4-dioxygenase beta subunit
MKRIGLPAMRLVFAALMAFPMAALAAEGCAISGRVVDERGIPIPSAAVSAFRRAGLGDDLLAKQSPVSSAVADPKGEYCLRGLPPGKYIIRAFARTHPPSASPQCDSCYGPNETEFHATYYPSTAAAEHATALDAGHGKNAVGTDIILRRERAYCLRGEVRDGNGTLMADVAVALEADSWSAGVFNEGGRFLLTSLPAGTYTIVISDRRKLGRTRARKLIHVAPGNLADLVVRIPDRSR